MNTRHALFEADLGCASELTRGTATKYPEPGGMRDFAGIGDDD